MKTTVRYLISTAIKISIAVLLSGMSANAFAEYYVVYQGDGSGYGYDRPYGYEARYSSCGGCKRYTCSPCVRSYECVRCRPCCERVRYTTTVVQEPVYIYSSSPRRFASSYVNETVSYAWVPYP